MTALGARIEANGGAAVVVRRISGTRRRGISGTYSATKFAVPGMTDSVRRELRGTGVGVTLIEPGYIATAGNAHRTNLPGPDVVAAAVERALKRPRRRIVVPVRYRAAIVLANALPGITDRIYAGKAAAGRTLKRGRADR